MSRRSRRIPPEADAGEGVMVVQGHSDAASRTMRAFRFPALLVVVALLVAAVVVDRRLDAQRGAPVETTDLAKLMPVASPAGALSSTWFCAAGSAVGSAEAPARDSLGAASPVIAEHTISIGNFSDGVRTVRVTAFPSEGDRVERSVEVGPRSRLDVALTDLVIAPFASALVEADGGLVAVEHRVAGPFGRSVAPCASSTSARWYFPAGATRLGTRQVFVVFNPFPDEAVLDFAFETDDGRRESPKFEGLVVPAGGVVPVDITDVITVREQIATAVEVRTGRVVIDQLLASDGTNGQPASLALVPGAPGAADAWVFGEGAPIEDGVEQTFVVYNPSTMQTEVDLFVQPDVPAIGGPIQPFELSVRPGQYTSVSITRDNRVPRSTGYWAVARTRKGGSIVVARTTRTTQPATSSGFAVTLGSPLVATRWLVPMGGVAGEVRARLAIANPSEAAVTVTVRLVRNGDASAVERFDRVTLDPGARTLVDIRDFAGRGAIGAAMFEVQATGPVAVERRADLGTAPTPTDSTAVPVADGLALVPSGAIAVADVPIDVGHDGLGTLPLGTLDPSGSGVPGTGSAGSVPGGGTGAPGAPGAAGTGPGGAGAGPSTTAPASTTTASASTTTTARPPVP